MQRHTAGTNSSACSGQPPLLAAIRAQLELERLEAFHGSD
jgi:hypothetical protein